MFEVLAALGGGGRRLVSGSDGFVLAGDPIVSCVEQPVRFGEVAVGVIESVLGVGESFAGPAAPPAAAGLGQLLGGEVELALGVGVGPVVPLVGTGSGQLVGAVAGQVGVE